MDTTLPSTPTRDRTRVLIIDDDEELCALTADYLKPLGFQVHAVFTGTGGIAAAKGEWEAVILDVMLPDFDGFEVLRAIRRFSNVPVLMLTGRGEEVDRVVGLELGADDYLPKTFSSRELLARLRAAVRRSKWTVRTEEEAPKCLAVGPLCIFPESQSATLHGNPLTLTKTEYDVLLALVRAKGRVRSREQLFDEVHGAEWDVFDRAIDMHISVLRRKLGDDVKEPRFIRTVRGVGYMMLEPESV